MKGVRFYEELEHKNRKYEASKGTVFAAFYEQTHGGRHGDGAYFVQVDGVGAVFDRPNSPVAGTSASLEYLEKDCRRVSEERAREVHPELFKYLDSED